MNRGKSKKDISYEARAALRDRACPTNGSDRGSLRDHDLTLLVINYVGLNKLPTTWHERASFAKKLLILREEVGFKYDNGVEPFSTVEKLKSARNSLAHGKPLKLTAKVSSSRELADAMRPSWSSLVSDPELVLEFFNEVKKFEGLLFECAGIRRAEALTSAIGGG